MSYRYPVLFIWALYLGFFTWVSRASESTISNTVIDRHFIQVQADYHYLVGEIASLNKEKIAAVYHFKESATYSFSFDIQLRLAQEYIHQKLYKEAHQAARHLLSQNFGSRKIIVHHLLARIYTSLNLLEEASDQYKQMLSMDPTHKEAYFNQKFLVTELTKGKKAPDFQLLAKHPNLLTRLGDIHLSFNQLQSAIQCYKQALKINSSHRQAAFKLFQIYGQNGEYKKWIRWMNQHPSTDMFIAFLKAQAHLRVTQWDLFLDQTFDILQDYSTSQQWLRYAKQ